MEDFEILARYPNKKVNPGLGEVFNEKVLVSYKGSVPQIHAPSIVKDMERVKNFEVHPDDVFICGFMRSGTTLTQEMVWLILHDFNFDEAKKVDAYNRAQDFDYFSQLYELQGVDINHIEKLKRPRVLKTHYSVDFLPPKIFTSNARIVYISRDVKDVAVSNFYIRNLYFREELDSMEEVYDDFLNDRTWFAPYREYLRDFKNIKDKANILFLTYEEASTNKEEAIRQVAKFLGKEASEENVKKLAAYLDFKEMKKNPLTNMKMYWEEFNKTMGRYENPDNFIRKGKVGGYKEFMSDEYAKKFDAWLNEPLKY